MSHEIEMTADGRSMFVGKQDAWHRLGFTIGEEFGIEEIERVAPEILMPVTLQPTYVVVNGDFGPEYVETPTKAAVVRADGKVVGEGLGKESYGIVQQRDAYEWGQEFAGLADMPLVSAGLIREGRQFFFTYDAGSASADGVDLNTHLTVTSSHDGSLPFMALHSTTVVVCANTLAMALGNAKDRLVLRHTSKIEDRMEQALAAIRTGVEHTQATVQTINRLQAIKVRDFSPLLDGVLPVIDTAGRSQTMRDNARDAVRQFLRSAYTEGHESTGWAFVQAVNTYEQWVQPTRKPKGSTDDVRALRQFDSMVKGSQPLTQKAIERVLAFA